MAKQPIDVSLQDLRAMIHALKMAGLSFVEPDAQQELLYLIQRLPSPEELNKLAEVPENLRKVREEIGYIMGLVDAYGYRGPEYKARYLSKTDLPPRYKILEWRDIMKEEARVAIKELVKLSSIADNKKDTEGALILLKCARELQGKAVTENTMAEVDAVIEKFSDNEGKAARTAVASLRTKQNLYGDLIKKAQVNVAEEMKTLNSIRSKFTQLGKLIPNAIAEINKSGGKVKNREIREYYGQIVGLLGQVKNISGQVSKYMNDLAVETDKEARKRKQQEQKTKQQQKQQPKGIPTENILSNNSIGQLRIASGDKVSSPRMKKEAVFGFSQSERGVKYIQTVNNKIVEIDNVLKSIYRDLTRLIGNVGIEGGRMEGNLRTKGIEQQLKQFQQYFMQMQAIILQAKERVGLVDDIFSLADEDKSGAIEADELDKVNEEGTPSDLEGEKVDAEAEMTPEQVAKQKQDLIQQIHQAGENTKLELYDPETLQQILDLLKQGIPQAAPAAAPAAAPQPQTGVGYTSASTKFNLKKYASRK